MNKNITIKKIIIFTICIASIICIVFLVRNVIFDVNRKSFGSVKLVTEYDENTTIDEMKTVTFGLYPQSDITGNIKEPIEWIVLDRQGGRTFLLSKYILDCKSYDNSGENTTWETCSLRSWLNIDFYFQAFSDSEQNKIQMTNVINNNNIDYDINGGNNTNDKIFCLSIEEIRKYFGNGTKKKYGYQLGKNVATRGTNFAKNVDNYGYKLWVSDSSDEWYFGNSYFWLRSPGYIQLRAADVCDVGYLRTNGIDIGSPGIGVRPALWISE